MVDWQGFRSPEFLATKQLRLLCVELRLIVLVGFSDWTADVFGVRTDQYSYRQSCKSDLARHAVVLGPCFGPVKRHPALSRLEVEGVEFGNLLSCRMNAWRSSGHA